MRNTRLRAAADWLVFAVVVLAVYLFVPLAG